MPPFDTALQILILCALVGYGLGSIPSGVILTRAMGLGDLRAIGSGNIGATNVLRTGNKTAAALTLLLDGLKGVIAVVLGRLLAGEDGAQVAGLLAFIGHCYPVWLGFKGGKGFATFLGLWLALAWPVGLACCLTWLGAAFAGRMSSLAALVSAASSTVWLLVFGSGDAMLLGIVLTLMVFWRHRANITRLRNRTEPRIGAK